MEWTVCKTALTHIAYVGAEATEAVEPKHRPDLNSAEAMAERHVPMLRFNKQKVLVYEDLATMHIDVVITDKLF